MRKGELIGAIFPQARKQILAAMLLDADRRWYFSDLARHIGVTPSSLQRELASLVQAGILMKTPDGNRTYYQADTTCPIFPELRGLLIKTAGLVDQVRAALKPFASKIQLGFIFGSFATSDDRSSSDVDILVVGSVKLAALTSSLPALEARLSRPVNVVLYNQTEFRDKLRTGNHFLTALIDRPKLFIFGTEHDVAAIREGGTGESAPNFEGRARRPSGHRKARP